MLAQNGITVAIVILNSVLKVVNTYLIERIGYPYNSDVISTIVVSVFVSQFVNTAVVLTIANANFRDTPIRALGKLVDTLYKDFTLSWYSDVGG